MKLSELKFIFDMDNPDSSSSSAPNEELDPRLTLRAKMLIAAESRREDSSQSEQSGSSS